MTSLITQSDVRGLESGTTSFQITTTSSNTTTLNVREDGVIVFEGNWWCKRNHTYSIDPTPDRTISLPNETEL